MNTVCLAGVLPLEFGYFVVPSKTELFASCLQRTVADAIKQDAKVSNTLVQLSFAVADVLLQLWGPLSLEAEEKLSREVKASSGQHRWRVLEHPLLDQRQLYQVSSQIPQFF